MVIRKLLTADDLESAFALLIELRTQLSWNDFLNIYDEASKRDDFEIAGAFIENDIVGIIGYRVLFDFVHGKHLYIDDLIVTQHERSKGIGAQLMKYAELQAQINQCKRIRLCTGIGNEKAIKFYTRVGCELKAIVFKKNVELKRTRVILNA